MDDMKIFDDRSLFFRHEIGAARLSVNTIDYFTP
jgi:hypothetical protein